MSNTPNMSDLWLSVLWLETVCCASCIQTHREQNWMQGWKESNNFIISVHALTGRLNWTLETTATVKVNSHQGSAKDMLLIKQSTLHLPIAAISKSLFKRSARLLVSCFGNPFFSEVPTLKYDIPEPVWIRETSCLTGEPNGAPNRNGASWLFFPNQEMLN